jgi:uncharacterized protein
MSRPSGTDNPKVVADQSDVIAFLSRPETYGIPEHPVRIDTHAAIVFLAGARAYKMKRAVRYPFLDFSTLERRRAVCEAELALNRSYAPELYIDTVPVVRRDGALALGGDGTVVEWLVRMRRFDPADTLDHVTERSGLTDAIIAELVAAISHAHRVAPTGDGDAATRRLGDWMRGNTEELAESPEAIPGDDVAALRHASQAELDRLGALLLARGRAGFVRRCHGDLHLRNIVLIDGRPVLFDALEFDDDLATHDVLYDLAFLLMDLWQRGMHAAANRVFNRYLWLSGAADDIDGCALLPLFMSIRAAIRAKVALSTAKLEEPQKADRDVAEARHYFACARNLLTRVAPVLMAIGGLSGSGKTTISAALAPEVGRPPGALHLRSDIERKRLFNVADTDRLPGSAYTQETSDEIYARLRDKAGRALRAGQSAVVDAVHARPAERAAIERVARENGVPFVGIWLDAPESVLLERVAGRSGDASDADTGVVRHQLTHDVGPIRWHRVDTAEGDHLERCRTLLGGHARRTAT